MGTQVSVSASETMECPLCLGEGKLKRAEVLERLGMKDFARVAQLSAEEAFRLLRQKQTQDESNAWVRFETELTKQVTAITERYNSQLQTLRNEKGGLEIRLQELENNQAEILKNAKQSERLETEKGLRDEMWALDGRIKELEAQAKVAESQKAVEVERVRLELEGKLGAEQTQNKDLTRRVDDYFGEISKLRERNTELEAEMAKVARVGKREEMDFADEARTWAGIWISEKLSKYGDYILAYRDPSGSPLEPRMLVDNKDKESIITEGDIDKLIRDANERSIPVAVLLTRDENQLRQLDRDTRWSPKDGIWILRTTRQWLARDLDVLKPLFERMRVEGSDFLQKNAALAEEVRRTFADIDEIEKELRKASRAIESASDLVGSYRVRLQSLCDVAATEKITSRLAGIDPNSAEPRTVVA